MKIRTPRPIRKPRTEPIEPPPAPIAKLDPSMLGALNQFNSLLERMDEWLKETFTEPSPFSDDGQAAADANLEARLRFGPPMGYAWYVERFTHEATAGAPVVRVYLDRESISQLKDVSEAALRNVADEVQPIWVPEGTKLIFFASGMAAGSRIGINLQGKVVRA